MKKKVRIILGLTVLIFTSASVNAQKGKEDGSKYGHGEDSIKCLRNLSLYREYVKNKDLPMANTYWVNVFDECPKASKNIYIDGAKIYKSFLDKNSDPNRKNTLTDTLMLIYERRIVHFGEKGKVRGRQGADLLRFRRNDGEEYLKQGYDYLKESITLLDEKVSDAVLPTLLSASITLGNSGTFEAKQVIEDYLLVSRIIDAKIAKKPSPRIIDLKKAMDANFVEEGPGDCKTLVGFFEEEIKTKKEDTAFLEMLTNLLSNRECTDNELYYMAVKDLHRLAPSASSAVKIALLAGSKNLSDDAVKYFQEALQLETDNSKKADIYFNLALTYKKAGQNSKSKEAALKAVNNKPGFGESYLLIGQLYADSKKSCTNTSENKNLPNAVYWAAVDMFIKAKRTDATLEEQANKLILTYTPHFPNKEEAFFKGWNEGDTYRIGCWINESTKVRF
jgi:tetratricopeptide (TPR) repeat protein